LLATLGEGASSVVSHARVREELAGLPVGIEVALKLARSVEDQGAANARLHREARLGRRVAHPGLAAVLATGELEHEDLTLAWVAFELVEGRTLRGLMEELGTIPEALLRVIAARVSATLVAVHEASLVHRDLKPENVVVTEDHEVKLLDLGLASDRQVPGADDERFLGTPAYAAPEVLASEPATPAADRHSLGVMLFEGAGGARPFDGDGVMRGPRREAPALGSVAPQVSSWFEEVVATLLEPAPESRFASTGELLDVLEEGEDSRWWGERLRAVEGAGRARAWWPDRAAAEVPLAGREAELESLREAFARAQEGCGGLVLVEGEAGVGKTRLLQELVSALETEGRSFLGLHGQARPGASALGQSLLRRFGRAGLHGALLRHVGGGPELRASLAAWVLEKEGSGGAGEALAGLRRLLASASSESPLLWLIEDLHAASAEDLRLLRELATVAASRAALLVATTRPGRGELSALGAERLSLGPLGSEHARALLLAKGLDDDSAQRLLEGATAVASGNPLFALRLVDELAAEGALSRDAEGRWRLPGEAAACIPDSLSELLGARLANLTASERSLLDLAAIEGEEFDARVVASALGVSEVETLELLGLLERRDQLVISAGRRHRFAHPLLRETATAGLSGEQRRQAHLALAEAWGHAEQAPRVRAVGHALRAGAPAMIDDELVPALTVLDRACLHEELLDLAALALESTPIANATRRSQLLKLRANALALPGRDEERAAALEEALEEAERAGDASLVTVRRFDLAVVRSEQGRVEEAAALATQASSDAEAAGEGVVFEKSLGVLAQIATRAGRHEEAACHAERAIASARARGDRDSEAKGQALLGVAHHRCGRLDDARACAESQLGRWRETGDRYREAYALEALGAVLNDLGERQQAREAHEEARRLFADLGHSVGESGAGMSLANDLLHLGDFDGAQRVAEESLCVARELGRPDLECGLLINVGLARFELGDLDGAASDLEAARRQAGERGWTPWEAYASSSLGRVAEWAGDQARARDRHAAALELLRPLGLDFETGRAALGLGLVLLNAGETREAVALIEEASALLGDAVLDLDGATPAVALVRAGRREPKGVTVSKRLPVRTRAECHLLLFEAGGGARQLNRAWNLIEEIAGRLPASKRARFRQGNAVARRVLEAAGGSGA
jgi:tetratricopeptide (TPR) repeat protein